jgi:hypothetical protein
LDLELEVKYYADPLKPAGSDRVLRRWCQKSLEAGLPDNMYSNQKSRFGKILDGLAIEDVGILYGHSIHIIYFTATFLVYFVAIWYLYFIVIWYILWPFGIFHGYLVYFVAIWCISWLFDMYIFPVFGILHGYLICIFFLFFGMLCQEKSGSPDWK